MKGIKYRVLIVDDDEGRNDTYHRAFDSMFSVTITNDIPNLTKSVVCNYDILIIDVVLGQGSNSNAFAYLTSLEITIPTVIISGQWVNEGNPSQSILRVPEFNNIIKVVGWNELTSENYQRISEDIYIEFCKRKNLRRENKRDVCTILQISDMQFGGDVSSSAFNDDERISEFLKKNSLVPDLVVIAGDIADKGQEIEYHEAEKWITKFASKLWGNYGVLQNPKEKERILIVPGNHDYDLSISASDIYTMKFNAPEINSFDKNEGEIEYKNQKLGFYNFSRFARNLYEDDRWLKYADCAIHYNEQFINWGLNIISLNSVYKITNQNCENRFEQFYCDYSKLNENDLPVNKSIATAFDTLCNILIVHNPPSDFKNNRENGIKSWQKIQTIIEDNKVNICLYGHTHDNSLPYLLRDNGGQYSKKMICIPSPSLRLSSSAITEDSHRGFNIIELHKNDGVISSVIVRRFKLVNASICEITDSEDSVFLISKK